MAKISHSKKWLPKFTQLTTSRPHTAYSSPTLPPRWWRRIMEQIPLTWPSWIFIVIREESNTTDRWHVSSIWACTWYIYLINDARYILIGQDSSLDPDQGKPCISQIEELLASATGKDKAGNTVLTSKDLAAYNAKRRIEAKASNPNFTLDTAHKIFGSTK